MIPSIYVQAGNASRRYRRSSMGMAMKAKSATGRLLAAFLLVCLLGAAVLFVRTTGGSTDPGQVIPDEAEHAVQIFVECKENLKFSRYDVDVELDGEKIGTVEHGGAQAFELSLSMGQHELVFVKEGASEPDGRASFVVKGWGDAFSYLISCTEDQIGVEAIGDEAEPAKEEPAKEEATKEEPPAEEAPTVEAKEDPPAEEATKEEPPAEKESTTEEPAKEESLSEEPRHAVELLVDCEKNVKFSRYDVDVDVDGERVGTIEHGGRATFALSLAEGQHELAFREAGEAEPEGKVDFVVEGEGDSFSYEIHCTRNKIKVEPIEDEAEGHSENDAKEELVKDEPRRAVELLVDCEKNVKFSRYDVDVEVDGERVGTIEHGSKATFALSLAEGQHELAFREAGETEPEGKVDFVVEGEGDSFSYEIHCTRNKIKVEPIGE